MTSTQNSYRFIILALIMTAAGSVSFAHFQVGMAASELMDKFAVGHSGFGFIMGSTLLMGAFAGLLCGALADRFGVKWVLVAAMAVNTFGLWGRLYADSALYFGLCMFLAGAGNAAINANVVKLLSAWFPAGRIAQAMGFYMASVALGQSLALVTTPRFSSTLAAFQFAAGFGVATTLALALLLRKNPKASEAEGHEPMGRALAVAVKNKSLWLGATGAFLYMGAFLTLNSFLPHSLQTYRGISDDKSGLITAGVTLAAVLGALLSSSVLKFFGSSKILFRSMLFTAGLFIYFFWIFAFGALPLTLLYAGVFILSCSLTVTLTMPAALPEIGPRYAGSAGGLLSTVQMAGGFILPGLIPALAGENPGGIFMISAACVILMSFILARAPELYRPGH